MNNQNTLQLLCFTINNQWFALEIKNIEEIVKPVKHIKSSTDSDISRTYSYRGTDLPFLFLENRLFNSAAAIPKDYRILIIKSGERMQAVIVDTAEEIIHIGRDNLRPLGQESSDLQTDLLNGKIVLEDRVVYIVSAANLSALVRAE